MAEKDPETDKLELSLFRRKRKKDTSAPAAEVAPTTDAAVAPSAPAATPAPAPAEPAAREVPDTSRVATSPAPRASRGPGGARVAPKQPRKPVKLPQLAPNLAVLVVGAVVGLAAVALTFVSLQLCELVTGTDSCGGPGLVVLLAVVVLMILGGAAALRMLGVSEPGGLSFLGVAMFVAVCLVALLPNLLEVWMIVVAPVVSAITFWIAHWIVTRFDEDLLQEDGPPSHDVR